MVHPLLDELREGTRLAGEPGSDVRNAHRQVQFQRMGLRFQLPERRAAGDRAFQGGRRALALCQPVNSVVHDYRADIQVSGRLRSDVLRADAEEVAVPGHHHHVQAWFGHLDA